MFTEEEEEEEGEDERDVAWDPSMATPTMARRGAGRARAAAGHASPRGRSGEASAGSSRGSGGGAAGADRAAWERPVLARVNAERAERGMEPASRLTVRTLREHLTGRIIGGKGEAAARCVQWGDRPACDKSSSSKQLVCVCWVSSVAVQARSRCVVSAPRPPPSPGPRSLARRAQGPGPNGR